MRRAINIALVLGSIFVNVTAASPNKNCLRDGSAKNAIP